MLYQITSIAFDCSLDDDCWDYSDQICTEEKLAQEYVGQVWEADDEEDLVEEISAATGWCVLEIDYRHVLK